MNIIKPEKKYLQSYYEACVETWGHVHDSYIMHNPSEFKSWKQTIFDDYKNQENGINLPEGFVSSQTYWLTENDEYVGTINIRPELNDRLKEYGGHAGFFIRVKYRNQGYAKKAGKWILSKLNELNVKEAIMTCEETNTQSQKVLEWLSPAKCETDVVLLNNRQTKIKRYFYHPY